MRLLIIVAAVAAVACVDVAPLSAPLDAQAAFGNALEPPGTGEDTTISCRMEGTTVTDPEGRTIVVDLYVCDTIIGPRPH